MILPCRILAACGFLLLAPLMPGTLAPAPAHAQQQKSFVNEFLASNAIRLEAQVRKEAETRNDRRPAAALLREAMERLQRNDPRAALEPLASAAAASPANATLWLQYSRASILTALRESDQRWRLLDNAASAAYLSYQRATDAAGEARALAMLGNAFGHQQSWRPALDAYRASLALADDAAVRKIHDDIRARHGFRVLRYRVESDSLRPRVCFEFSEQLATDVADFAPFVAISGAANGAVVREDRDLCVEGLAHGERYAIVLRQGLPSAVEETLLKPADYEIFVRDRSPQVRFTGRNYVLPRTGQEGVPVVSTNTDKIAIDILRIGDRSLPPTVRSNDFLAQIGSWRAGEMLRNEGRKVWSGTLDVTPQLNQDVVTAFPVLEAVQSLEPGVYAMLAIPGDRPVSERLASDNDHVDSIATQWFVVSDLGLTAFSGQNGLHVLVRSLTSAEPLAGVEVRLMARNNEVLATQRSDEAGHVRFAPGLARGGDGLAPGLIVASGEGGDYNFLDLVQPPFDLADRGVAGRPAPQPLDAFVYAERGVYRSGETAHLTALVRDSAGQAVTGMPLTFVVRRPDGVEYLRTRVEDQGLGGRALAVSLFANAPTGAWRVQIFADPKSPAVGETRFLVEDYVPERLEAILTPQDAILRQQEESAIAVEARFLYGAPGAGLAISGEMSIRAVASGQAPGLPGFRAGLQDQEFDAVVEEIGGDITTDAQGRAVVPITVPEIAATRPVEARIVLRAAEPGGRAVERIVTLPVRMARDFIAVRPTFETLREGSTATFDVIAASASGERRAASDLRWSLYRINRSYQWHFSGGRWQFEEVQSARRVGEGRIDAAADAPAQIAAPVSWGSYRLDIAAGDGALNPVSTSFNVGWSGEASAGAPDLLEVTLDKRAYSAGDALNLRIVSRFAGKATLAIVGEQVHHTRIVDLKEGDNDITLPVAAEWGASAYALALAHRPLDQQARRMPGRALGLAWFSVDADKRRLEVNIETPERAEPRSTLRMPVRIGGLEPGEEAYVTVAAVDVGILNLTGYATPDPERHYFGQRRLGIEIRDLYGMLIDGMQGTRGAIRGGGDAVGAGMEGDRPTQEPMARFSGVVRVGPDGVAHVEFDLPAFNGTARIMAVAWSRGRAGAAQKDLVIRDRVVAQATLPRFLNFGDRSRFHIRVDNVDGPAGDYAVEFDLRGPVTVAADALRHSFRLEAKASTQFTIPVTAAGVGQAQIDMRLIGPDFEASQSFALRVAPGAGELQRRVARVIEPGQSIDISADLLADFLPGTGTVSLAVSPLAGVDVPALLQALDRYPYGCSEQLVSRALPLIYLDQLASAGDLALDPDLAGRIQTTIDRVLARQDAAGRFGAWSAGDGQDLWLDAFVADFLTRAREKGFAVAARGFDQALDWLRNQVANTSDVNASNSTDIAYAIYVLARNGRPVMGDLRYLAETRLDSFGTALSQAQLGAALALLGDRGRAAKVFDAAASTLARAQRTQYSRADYGSLLRDSAGFVTLAAEAGVRPDLLSGAALRLQDERNATALTSTQENAWMTLAAAAMAGRASETALSVDGAEHAGSLFRAWSGDALNGRAIRIGNAGKAPVQATLTVAGFPVGQEPAASAGYAIERSYFTMSGEPANFAQIRQNDRLVVVLKVTEQEAAHSRLLLVDLLPAGLEIDNPRLVDSGAIGALPWLTKTVEPVHTEYRDDRFVAAFTRNGQERAEFYTAYVVRAVTPGRYVAPPAAVEDMYRPNRFARTAYGELTVLDAQ